MSNAKHKKFSQEMVVAAAPTFPQGKQAKITPEIVADILNRIAERGTIGKACLENGILPGHLDKLRRVNPDLDNLVREARRMYHMVLEDTIHDRAVEGVEETVWFQGMAVGTKRVYSDPLLQMLLKRHLPEFRDKSQVDVNHSGGVLVVATPASPAQADEWLAKHKHKKDEETE